MSYLHGVERKDELNRIFTGKRIGLITNPTGLDRGFKATADMLAEEYRLSALYSTEHGVRGNVQAGGRVETYIDEKTGIPVYSTYGKDAKENAYADVDIIAYDIADVGARFYTYIYTLTTAMEEAARLGKKVVVLDRYNPIGLSKVEGALLDARFDSGVGKYGIPARYALTVGEFARYANEIGDIGCDLEIVKCQGLTRKDDHRTLGLDWVLPSPNLPTYESALAYIGTVLLEGTDMSEGRGTTKPFEMIGAPYLRAEEVIKYMENLGLKGFKLRECCFTPTFSKHKGELCRGFQIHITDPDSFEPFAFGVYMLDYVRKTHQELKIRDAESERSFINLLLGTDEFMKKDFNAESFVLKCKTQSKSFQKSTEKYFLY
ncbi:MAG: DUF1343 domain-containing protein [Clostridia bacterium]|nr:DUF1343 domain-containing protein [Clostridia bacterium]